MQFSDSSYEDQGLFHKPPDLSPQLSSITVRHMQDEEDDPLASALTNEFAFVDESFANLSEPSHRESPVGVGDNLSPDAQAAVSPTSLTSQGQNARNIGNLQAMNNRGIEIMRSTELHNRACDECRRRKAACYYLKGDDSKCFRCQMEDVECTFSAHSQRKSAPQSKSLPLQHKQVLGTGPVEDYSTLPGRSLLKKTLSLQHPRSSFAVGRFSLWDRCILNSVPLDRNGQSRMAPNLTLRKIDDDTFFLVRSEGGQYEWIKEADAIEQAVAPHGRALVNAYFHFCQPSYPVLQEKVFLEKYTRTYRELTPALLGAVYLTALKFWYQSTELRTAARPPQLGPQLQELALNSFFRNSGSVSLSIIQAGLLLIEATVGDGRHISIISVIKAIAYRLALHRDSTQWELPLWEINLRLRLSWAVVSQASWQALFESLPGLVDNSWNLNPLSLDNFETACMSPPDIALFITSMKLSLLVRDIHIFLLGDEGANAASMEEVLARVKPVQINLRQWYHDLPSVLTSKEKYFSLHILYLTAEVSIHRYIIRSLTEFQNKAAQDLEMVAVCRSSARDRLEAAAKLLQDLKPEYFQTYWPIATAPGIASLGVLAALMYRSSSSAAEAEFFKGYLTTYVDKISTFSEHEIMATANSMLHSSLAGVPGINI